jgi:hypothetical protein
MIFASRRAIADAAQLRVLLDVPLAPGAGEAEVRRVTTELVLAGATDEQIGAKLAGAGVAADRVSALLAESRTAALSERNRRRRFDRVAGSVGLGVGVVLVIVSRLTIDDAVLYLPGIAAIAFGLVRLIRG